MITDGKHPARLFDVTRFRTEDGRDAVAFVWELTDCGERISSTLTLVDAHGAKNHFGICLVKKWAPDWPSDDLDWLSSHVSELHTRQLFIHVRGGKVDWIFPSDYWADTQSTAKTSQRSEDNYQTPADTSRRKLKIQLHPERIAEFPEKIPGDFPSAKALFDTLTEGSDKLDADAFWTRLVKKIGTLQVNFTEADWLRMIETIKRIEDLIGSLTRSGDLSVNPLNPTN